MKKFLIIGLIIMMVTFFSLPALAFADEVTEPDNYTYSGTDDGQITMDIMGDGDTDPDTDVLCIDPCLDINEDSGAYTDTGVYVSEVLQLEIDPTNAIAVEILATTASGGSDAENQEAVTDLVNEDLDPTPNEDSEVIENAVMDVAAGYEAAKLLDPTLTLEQYLASINVNDVEITLDPDPLVDPVTLDTNDKFVATAIMENPLVPTITDENKTTYWYILAGSYNVSFSEFDLVTETTSMMNDVVDDADATPSEDNDGDGTTDDSYGLATIPYYYYWWGVGYPEYEEMNVNMFAWVDIDEDTKLDITDLPGDGALVPGDPGYIDGDVVGSFMAANQVVITQEETPGDPATKHIIVDEDIDGIADTEPVLDDCLEVEETKTCTNGEWWFGGWYWHCNHSGSPHSGWVSNQYDKPEYTITKCINEFDVCDKVGGIVLEGDPIQTWVRNYTSCSNGDWWTFPDGNKYWVCYGHGCDRHKCGDDGMPKYRCVEEDTQRVVIENYSEPFATASKLYEAWGSLDLTKTNSATGALVPGATYQLAYVDGPSLGIDPIQMVTDANGNIDFGGLPWGTYELTEIIAPAGFTLDATVYTFYIGGNALFTDEGIDNVLAAVAPVENDPIPSGGGVPPVITTAGLTTLEVAGISEEEEEEGAISVLGIAELPFTGSNLVFILIGVLMAVCGLGAYMYLRKSTAK